MLWACYISLRSLWTLYYYYNVTKKIKKKFLPRKDNWGGQGMGGWRKRWTLHLNVLPSGPGTKRGDRWYHRGIMMESSSPGRTPGTGHREKGQRSWKVSWTPDWKKSFGFASTSWRGRPRWRSQTGCARQGPGRTGNTSFWWLGMESGVRWGVATGGAEEAGRGQLAKHCCARLWSSGFIFKGATNSF